MVVIDTEPWREGERTAEEKRQKAAQDEADKQLFGFQDLASDYYQVLRQRSRPRYCRILWGITIVTLLGFTLYMIYKLIYDYLQFDSFNMASTEWKSSIKLPAITICGTNFVNYTDLTRELQTKPSQSGGTLLDDFDSLLTDITKFSTQGNVVESLDFERYKELLDWETDNGNIDVRFSTGIYDMLVGEYDFLFKGLGYYMPNVYKFVQPTELGNCLELFDEGTVSQDTSGPGGGLQLDLDAKVRDYLFTTPTKGFVIFIRDQNETVMLNSGGYLVSPGTETFLKLSARSVSRLGKPHGTCQNNPSSYTAPGVQRFETVRECKQRQTLEAMIEHCGCIPWYFADRMLSLGRYDVLDAAVNLTLKEDKDHQDISYEHEEHDEGGHLDEDEGGHHDEDEPEEEDHRRRKRRSQTLREALREVRHSRPQRSAQRNRDAQPRRDARDAQPRRDARDAQPRRDASGEEPAHSTTQIPIYKTNYSSSICTFTIQAVCNSIVAAEIQTGEVVMKGCPEPCVYPEWDVDIATATFPPTQRYFDKFLKFSVYMNPPPTLEYVQQNMARVHIFYEDIKEEHLDQKKAYEEQSFVAEFGGTVDLFIGFSFFTVFQLIEICIATCVYRCMRRRPKMHCTQQSLPSLDERDIVQENGGAIARDTGSRSALARDTGSRSALARDTGSKGALAWDNGNQEMGLVHVGQSRDKMGEGTIEINMEDNGQRHSDYINTENSGEDRTMASSVL